ncbi:hypothetical protein, partial [Desulfallas sp. Bu1-1]|uniref:hypothetical protein n=1 Tax=Desulfallas sp. Bu1-1 TaxID=2787620 RepID=UPI001A9A8A5B
PEFDEFLYRYVYLGHSVFRSPFLFIFYHMATCFLNAGLFFLPLHLLFLFPGQTRRGQPGRLPGLASARCLI